MNWVEIPDGLLRRGTPVDEVTAVACRYADTGVPVEWYTKEAPRAEIHVPAFRIARTGAPCGASSQSGVCRVERAGPRSSRSFCSTHPDAGRRRSVGLSGLIT
ncbi:hypothetical protein [Streptomyces phaeochromogenes]|uniref:hypothetical protein n=1 Tax=Streptomyces phaeochromogenes TaxID=1923 RepID=UPI00386F1CA0